MSVLQERAGGGGLQPHKERFIPVPGTLEPRFPSLSWILWKKLLDVGSFPHYPQGASRSAFRNWLPASTVAWLWSALLVSLSLGFKALKTTTNSSLKFWWDFRRKENEMPQAGFAQISRRRVMGWGCSGDDVLQGRWKVLGFFGNEEEAVAGVRRFGRLRTDGQPGWKGMLC